MFATTTTTTDRMYPTQQQTKTTELPGIGSPNWFYLVLLSPYAGIYYWKSGDRVDDMKVKLSTNDDDTMNEITIEGNDEEIGKQQESLELRVLCGV